MPPRLNSPIRNHGHTTLSGTPDRYRTTAINRQPNGKAITAKDIAAALRKWASGSYCIEAATELIIRASQGRFAEPGWPLDPHR